MSWTFSPAQTYALSVHSGLVPRNWRRQVEGREGQPTTDVFPGQGRLPSQEEELRRLRREVEMLRQERDFLKKTAAYFAKESR